MAKNKLLASHRRKQISYEDFMARHENARQVIAFLVPSKRAGSSQSLAAVLAFPSRERALPPVMQDLKQHPLFRLLRAAARENCPDAYNVLLYIWLCRMGMVPPEGVFTEPRGKGGRPRDPETALITEKWMELGCPPLGRRRLAFAIYGPTFTKASSPDRKKMVDRCRRAVERRNQQLRPNSVPI
jgi:hypothetical protein